MKSLLLLIVLLITTPSFACVEYSNIPPQYKQIKKPNFIEKIILKKLLKKTESEMTKGESIAGGIGVGLIVSALLFTLPVAIKLAFLIIGVILCLWTLFSILKHLK